MANNFRFETGKYELRIKQVGMRRLNPIIPLYDDQLMYDI